jgi:pimeloyl-ACP methyl ester carboxylesterase
VRIAYAESGAGPILIKAANWLNHLEYDWMSPLWTDFLHALAAENRLTRYDARGCGLSDWDVPEISFDAFLRDFETVVEATGHQRFALFGMSQGCAVSIAYAAKHPERVSRLVLCGGFARGRRKRGQPNAEEESRAATALIRQGWENENPAFRQMFASLMAPDASQEQIRAFNDMMLKTATADCAARFREAVDLIDVTDQLAHVKAPTLVMHCRNDAMAPFDEGRRLAAGIPGARFVALDGRNHVVLPTDPVWDRFIGEIRDFLRA